MTVYQGEEVSIEVDQRMDQTNNVVWINVDGQNVGELVSIYELDIPNFISELTAVIDKYKI